MLSAAGSLQWLHERLAPDISFEALVAEAGGWEPGTEGLLFAPYLAGERTPHADPDARGAFVGLQLRHDRGALVRSVLEGVAFGLRDVLDAVRRFGVEPSTGRVSGGGARSALWLRIVASALDMPLERTESEEGSALVPRSSVAWRVASSQTFTKRSRFVFAFASGSSLRLVGATRTQSCCLGIAPSTPP